MTETDTKAKTDAPQAAPPAQPIATVSRKEAWETFQDDLNKRADEIGSQLPANVPRDRFIGASLAAVKSNPGILTATPRSLMSALTKAAQDGLLPDGREGIITVYKTDGVYVAQWNPMFYGIRKRARELDGIIIDAQVVFNGDEFDYELGDNPFIKHKPKPRTEKLDASAGLAVYAIFRHPEQGILHREVMWKVDVFDVMNQSRAKGSLMWTTFWTEGWRKTVGRRGSKSVPVSPQLERLIQRDDENFTFDNPPQGQLTPPSPPSPPPAPPPADVKKPDHPEGAENLTPADQAGDFNDDDSGTTISGTSTEVAKDVVNIDAYLHRLDEDLGSAETEDAVIETFETIGVDKALAGDDAALKRAYAVREKHFNRVNGQTDMFPGDIPLTKAQKIAGTP